MHDFTLTETVQSSSTPSSVVSTPTKRWLATAMGANKRTILQNSSNNLTNLQLDEVIQKLTNSSSILTVI